jgi:4-hydroxybenzoyl-CoA reductase beta subunit
MLRLPSFGVIAPRTIEELVAALSTPGARIVAGGTDILPNLKHRLDRPALLVSTSQVPGLADVTRDDARGHLAIGASVALSDLARHEDVVRLFPSLAQAAGLVASPTIRNMATIGGNIHLDTRCRYVNQSDFWRSAMGGCLKSEGDVCHVVKGGQNCVAAMSSDCVPVLTTLDAALVLRGPAGERVVAIADYYNNDGVKHIDKADDEFMTEVRVPVPEHPRRTAYAKWTVRKSIDFPLISVALRFDLAEDRDDATIIDAKVCVGVLAAKPRLVRRVDKLVGQTIGDPTTAETLGKLVQSQCKPLGNVPYEADYRRKMLSVYTRRAIAAMLAR